MNESGLFLSDIKEIICNCPKSMELNKVAEKTCREIKKRWAGDRIYISKEFSIEISKRDKRLIADFDGSNHKYLARKYDITVNTVYVIVRRSVVE